MTAHATPGTGGADWRSQVEALEDEGRRAFLAGDTERLRDLWSDGLVVNSPIGRVLNRDQVLDLLRRGVIAHASFEVHVEVMERHGDTVIVMGHDVITDTPDSPTVERRFTDVWQIVEGSWRMIGRHANVRGPSSPRP